MGADQKFFEKYFGKPKTAWVRISKGYVQHAEGTKRRYVQSIKASGAESWAKATLNQRKVINQKMGGKFSMSIMNLADEVTPHFTVYSGKEKQTHSHGR